MIAETTKKKVSRAVFLDRDGIINELVFDPLSGEQEGPLRLEDVKLVDGACREILRLREAGYLLVGVTNQPAAAKGRISLELQDAIHARVLALLDENGVILDTWRVCPHHPSGTVTELTRDCFCRKPNPGMLLDAAEELGIDTASSWMVGDSDSDVEAGRSAGARTIRIGPQNSHKRSAITTATVTCMSFEAAVNAIRGGNDL